nr:phospholipase A2 inhibitor and Ly6/PLAUR domain-containing protein-like isoform X1 [Pogona vitticeps]XP_020668437.1 phospholipase A2 inhibitor and Ly6/PLAUR domain-containing protein-like isoform X1 [Pogona vitticeps]
MKLVFFHLFAALVVTTYALVCDCTKGPGCNSDGTCSVPELTGVCLTMAHENNLAGTKTSGLYKACQYDAQACSEKVMSITAEKGLFWRSNTACCNQDNCNTASIRVPPKNLTQNAQRCPACFTFASDRCENTERLSCTGAESHCITVSGMLSAGSEPFSPFAAAGCSTATACSLPIRAALYLENMAFVFNKVVCHPAVNASSGGS